MLTSYHNHTSRCNHATGTPEEYILRAIKSNYRIFGFSDHAPHCFTDMIFGARMRMDELGAYVAEILALREKYKNSIDIRLGLELEYYPKTHAEDMAIYKSHGIEYFILGQHNIGNGTIGSVNSFAATSSAELYTQYVDQCIDALDTGDFCCFAHPDVFKFIGDLDFYAEESDRLIKHAKERSIPLEVNLYGLAEGRHYPRDIFWKRAGLLGADVILGRDAHSVDRVHSDAELHQAAKFAKKYKLNLIDKLDI